MKHLRKTIFFILRYTSILLLSLALLFGVTTLIIYDKDINVTKILQSIFYIVESKDHKYDVENAFLRFESENKIFSLSLEELDFDSNILNITVQKMNLKFNPYNLLLNKDIVSKISASDYKLSIKIVPAGIDTDSKQNLLNNKQYNQDFLKESLISYNNFIADMYKIDISLQRGVIKLTTSEGGRDFEVGDLLIKTTPQNLKLNIKIGNSDVSLVSNLLGEIITSDLSITNLSLLDLQDIIPNNKYTKLIMTGAPVLSLNLKNKFNNEKEELDGILALNYDNQENSPEKLKQFSIKKINSSINLTKQGRDLNIKDINILFNDNSTISLSSQIKIGEIGGILEKKLIPESVLINIKMAGQTIDKIIDYWPDNTAPDISEWIKTSILQAKVTQASGAIKLDKEFFLTGSLNKDAITANVDLESSRINYIKIHPDVLASNIHVVFDNEKLTATSKTAKIDNGLVIDDVTVNVPYGSDPITLKVMASGPIKNYLFVIPTETIDGIAKEGLNLKKTNGNLKTNSDITLLKNDVEKLEDLKFIINVESELISIFNSYNLKKVNMKMTSQDGHLKIKTLAKVMDMDLDSDFDSSKTNPIEGKLIISNQSLISLGLGSILQNLSKDKNIELSFIKKNEYFNFFSDLSNNDLFFKIISYKKTPGNNLKLSFNINNHKDYLQLSEINLKGDDISLSGFVDITNDYSKFYFKDAKFGNDLFTADITSSLDKNIVIVSANFLDLSKALDDLKFDSKNTKANKMQIKVNKILFKNDIRANNFEVDLDCDNSYKCKNLHYKTIFEGGFISEAKKQGKDVEITSQSAEAFLKAFDISKDVARGTLKIKLTETASVVDPIVGDLEILDFSSVDTSVIVRLILGLSSFASPSTFSGKGILFKSAHSKLEFLDNKIYVKDGKMRSSAVTVYGSGVIDLKEKNVMFKGKIAPKIYGLNKAVASIPLFGTIVSGNSDNIIEATYTVSGNFGDVKTSINPLSILSIGFFKDLFN